MGFFVIKINSPTLLFQLVMVMEAAARVFVGCSRLDFPELEYKTSYCLMDDGMINVIS